MKTKKELFKEKLERENKTIIGEFTNEYFEDFVIYVIPRLNFMFSGDDNGWKEEKLDDPSFAFTTKEATQIYKILENVNMGGAIKNLFCFDCELQLN